MSKQRADVDVVYVQYDPLSLVFVPYSFNQISLLFFKKPAYRIWLGAGQGLSVSE